MTDMNLSEEIAYNANLWVSKAKIMQHELDAAENDRRVLIQELHNMADKVYALQQENEHLREMLASPNGAIVDLQIENQRLVDELNGQAREQAENLSNAMIEWMEEFDALQSACEYIDALAEDAFSYSMLIMEMTGNQEPWSKSYDVYLKLPQIVKDKLQALTDRRHEGE